MKRAWYSAVLLAGVVATGHARGGTPAVTYLERVSVEHAFERGAPLLETPELKVHASRRTEPGRAEVHTRDTDVIHVLEGTATFVTGGTMEGGESVAPDEIRGQRIEGGETRILQKGDVIVVPHGVPHWFQRVEGTFLYFVVKVTSPSSRS